MINKNRLINTFLELVKIDSPSGEEKAISKFIALKLSDLGGEVSFDSYGNLLGKFKGTGDAIMLNAHLDTVEPGRGISPLVKNDRITSDGRTVLGADAKSGIAMILEAITSLVEDKISHLPLDVLFTVEEETGLHGASNLDYTMLEAKYGITFDGQSSVNNITSSAPGFIRVDAAVIGRGAHAGYEPEKGLSAIKIAAEIITKLDVGRIDSETTANIGTIHGGSVRNAVPETVHIEAEIRSRNLEKLNAHKTHFEKVFKDASKKYTDAKIDLNLFKEFDPYLFDETQPLKKMALQAIKKIGLVPSLKPSGGATDVNIFHTKGLKALCVGAGYYNAHTTREYAVISKMVQGAKFCEEIVKI
ncbi:MAG TPA: M20/M25/M40 family metallo-hydrolase [Candidatus Limnocylindrales bacterium]|nr:M20/M25/M40 family metallo-hydrolase [Candidatus Limnocylindrales bacterium]